jgi:hypothetical protein
MSLPILPAPIIPIHQFHQQQLCESCEKGNLKLVKLIVESNLVDVNERCQYPDRRLAHIPLVHALDGITRNRDETRDIDFYEIIAFLISSGADVNYIYSSEFTQFTLFETKAYMLVKGNPRHKDLIDFLDDVSRGDVNEQILGICKILREKHIYLDFETMYELVQILKNEYPVLKSKGGKRKTRRQKRRQQRHTKSKH